MKVKVEDIKYFNHINELVHKYPFAEYVNFLLSIKSNRYLCYLSIDNYSKLKKSSDYEKINSIKSKLEQSLIQNEIIELVANYEEDTYVYLAKDDYEKVYEESLKNIRNIKKEEKITISIGVTNFSFGKDFEELMGVVTRQVDRAILKGGDCVVFAKETETFNGNLVEPHLVCKYCRKITNIYQFENNVLTPDKILANSHYKNIKIHRCNRCNVAALDLRNPILFDDSLLEGSDYQNILNKDIPDNEKNILLAVIINLSVNDYLNAGMLMYFYYELTKKENAKNYALEYLDNSDAMEAHILLLDFLRKTNEERIFKETVKYRHPKDKFHRMLINLEDYKMNNKDYGDLCYKDDISYKHFFKDDVNEHENLTGLELFTGDNIETIHSLFEISEEYILSSVLKYKDDYYSIFIVPYIGISRIYKIDIFNEYKIELVENKELFDSIFNEYHKSKGELIKKQIKKVHVKSFV